MIVELVLPAQRLWRWHVDLLSALRTEHTVRVRLAASPPYPAGLRLWLAFERLAFGPRGGVAPLRPDAFRVHAFRAHAFRVDASQADAFPADEAAGDGRADAVIDLSGAEPGSRGRLGLRYDGGGEPALFGALLRRRSARLEVVRGDEVLAASFPALEVKSELQRELAQVHARSISLLMRALTARSPAIVPPPSAKDPVPAAWGLVALAGFAVGCVAEKVSLKLGRGRWAREHWRLAIRRAAAAGSGATPDPAGFAPIALEADAFYADPFLIEVEGATWLFAEAYPYDLRKGVVVAARLDPQGRPGPFERVLEQPYHLSYPQVFAQGDDLYMMPETAQQRRVELYRARAFPHDWTLVASFLHGLRIADATLLQHEGRWWLFASVAEHGGASQDELFAFHAPELAGPWVPHGANPLKSDVRGARPAGRFVRRGGRLLRPAQDCEAGYGAGLVWFEVLELTPETYRERELARWRGGDFGPYTGVHTYAEGGGFEVVDLKGARP